MTLAPKAALSSAGLAVVAGGALPRAELGRPADFDIIAAAFVGTFI